MPALIEGGADLVLIAGLLLLIGMLYALRFTIVRAVQALDVSIAGLHPFHGIATTVENTVLAGVNAAIRASEAAIAGLWRGLVWSFEEMWKATRYLADQTITALGVLVHSKIPALIAIATNPLGALIGELPRAFSSVSAWVTHEVSRLEASIASHADAAIKTAERESEAYARGIEADVLHELDKAKTELLRGIDAGVKTSEHAATRAIDELRTAETAAVGAVRTAEQATAAELRNLLGELDLTKIAGVIAALPLLAAAVAALEAETGLDRAECRSKVRGICGTDPSEWADLLVGVAFLEGALSLRELVPVARGAIGELSGVIRQAA